MIKGGFSESYGTNLSKVSSKILAAFFATEQGFWIRKIQNGMLTPK
jgi:hypothetical protein